MKPWLLLPVETKIREFHAKLLLAAVAAERGFPVLLGEQNAMLRQIESLPRGIYLDKSVARTKTGHFQRLRRRGFKVVAWCEEGLVYRDRAAYLHERVLPDSLALAERFFCWGGVQQGDIAGHVGDLSDRLRITGNPRFDLLRAEYRDLFAPDVAALRARHGDFILLNTNFARYNHFQGDDFLIPMLKQRGTITSAEQERFFEAWRDFLGTLFHGFADMLAPLSAAFPDRTIVLRPHPSENHERWRALTRDLPNVIVAHEGNVVPWLMAASCLVHNSCTTGLEAWLLERPVIAYRPATSETYDSFLPNAVSHSVDTPHDLLAAIRGALAGERLDGGPAGADAAARYYGAIDGASAAERVSDELETLALPADQPRRPLARATSYLSQPALQLARRALRPKAAAYAAQKFSGIDLPEMRRELDRLRTVSGRFGNVSIAPYAWRCYTLNA